VRERPSNEPRTPSTTAPPSRERDQSINRDNWRGRGNDGSSRGSVRESSGSVTPRSSDVPRRIIDGIGGPRISGERPSRGSSGGSGGGNSGGSSHGSSSHSSGGESHKSSGGESHGKKN